MTHISLVAPSYSIPREDVALTQQYLEDLGMRVTAPADLLGHDILCANQDDIRLSHLQTALTDPSIDIVWLLSGGYGLTRLMPSLLQTKKPEKEKLFIGFSDGSALHVLLNQKWSWTSLHGPVAHQLAKKRVGNKTIEMTLGVIRAGFGAYAPPHLSPLNTPASKMSSLSGILTGGNLCLLTCSLGTDWQVKTEGKILFLEDIDEPGYRIDRMLVQLQQARIFDGVQAILLGDFVRGDEADGTSLIPPVLKRFTETTPVPVFRITDCGHGEENFPLPFNLPLNFFVTHEAQS
jgi:muramoyltetrapeptide carboxypeptidase